VITYAHLAAPGASGVEWIVLIALAFAALIAYNIVLAGQPHHVLNVYLQ
jgi:hypothetical protein